VSVAAPVVLSLHAHTSDKNSGSAIYKTVTQRYNLTNLCEISKFGKRLQGKTAGRRHYGNICETLAQVQPSTVVFLDFEGVESVNASWLNMAISPLVRWSAESQNDFFPVLSHFPERDFDELELVAEVNQQCFPVASDTNEPLRSVLLVGPLDHGLLTTLRNLITLDGATGAELARQVPDAGIQPTAWNNRLKELYDKRLLVRNRQGRRQMYYPIAREMELHGLQRFGRPGQEIEETPGEGDFQNVYAQTIRAPR
jgi:hypothetical protein